MDLDHYEWLKASRNVVSLMREMFASYPDLEARATEVGQGEGGDRTLVVDAKAEDIIFAELERLHQAGLSFTALSEERGSVEFGSSDLHVIIDPIDGSLNAKRCLPSYSVSIAVAAGTSMDDVAFGYVYDFGASEEWFAESGKGAYLNGQKLLSAGERRDSEGRLELVGFESADPRWLATINEPLGDQVARMRVIGSIALTLCQVAAGRLDAMASFRSCRSVDAAAAQLVLREVGGVVSFPLCGNELSSVPLDLLGHSPVVGAHAQGTLDELAALVKVSTQI